MTGFQCDVHFILEHSRDEELTTFPEGPRWSISATPSGDSCGQAVEYMGRNTLFGSGSITGFPDGSDGKESACYVGDLGSIPRSGRSPEEGNGNPLQYSCLENLMDGGIWRATVHVVTESDTMELLIRSLHFSVTW